MTTHTFQTTLMHKTVYLRTFTRYSVCHGHLAKGYFEIWGFS